MHGIDRLTGMPVLLHRLPEFVVPSAIPESASLLPVYEVDIWDGQPYAITELPLAAIPATHPGSAALGALRALAALHAAGQVHGGLNAGQLWQVGREVRLAGAGLPWHSGASTAGDLSALGQALDSMGARPAALNNLETLTAAQALAALEEALVGNRPPGQQHAERREAQQAMPGPFDRRQVERRQALGKAAEQAGSLASPAVQPPTDRLIGPSPRQLSQPEKARPLGVAPAEAAALPTNAPDSASPAEFPRAGSASQAAPTPAPVSYRSAQDIIVIGEPEAAPTPPPARDQAEEPVAGEPARSVPVRLIPAPIRIGFGEGPEALPDWTPDDWTPVERQERPEPLQSVHATPAGVREVALGRATRFVPATSPSAATSDPQGGQRGPPLRIGWEEDHSWRVVKSGPERRRLAAPRLRAGGARRAVLALLLALLGATAFWFAGRSGGASGCCTQRFTVGGGQQSVQVRLVQAPPGSPLRPGALIGTAPGVLTFPDVPGSYTLSFSTAGHAATTGTVTVPSTQAFEIALK